MSLASRVTIAKHVFIIGNGGSYANALHICNDLLACGIKAFTLDPSTLTAFANDHGYEYVFSKWLLVVAERGDLLIALSGSGKSRNILNAIRAAEYIGMDIEKVFGYPVMKMQEAEEYQIKLGHQLRKAILDSRPR